MGVTPEKLPNAVCTVCGHVITDIKQTGKCRACSASIHWDKKLRKKLKTQS